MVDFAPGPLPTQDVLFAVDRVAGRILLNRPRALNALNAPMVASALAQLREWERDEAVRTIVIEGAGDRGLCAGGDVRFLREQAATDPEAAQGFWREEYALDHAIATSGTPVVAVMDGVVMGGGVGLSAYASLRVATERSRVAMPETIIGFFPDVGATWLLSRAPGELGTHMALTGATISGGDAVAVGLADTVVASADIPRLVERLAAWEELGPEVGDVEPESALMGERSWIDECYAGDDPAVILDRLTSHPDPAARRAGADLAARSPLAVAVTLEALRRAARLESLREVLDQDEVLGRHFLAETSDFSEGVRAQLVDKDRNPTWRHASLADVTRDEVLAFFD
ncbi:enoyl-CoA hydratase/isomerase family protein [Janibacter sp. G1551]|uniref:enoyl-CoA hydratase/isomerase family protein n=1 Tax=Janibacter sp. G1551 TaxID=3420440 RepID=UPI003D04C29E